MNLLHALSSSVEKFGATVRQASPQTHGLMVLLIILTALPLVVLASRNNTDNRQRAGGGKDDPMHCAEWDGRRLDANNNVVATCDTTTFNFEKSGIGVPQGTTYNTSEQSACPDYGKLNPYYFQNCTETALQLPDTGYRSQPIAQADAAAIGHCAASDGYRYMGGQKLDANGNGAYVKCDMTSYDGSNPSCNPKYTATPPSADPEWAVGNPSYYTDNPYYFKNCEYVDRNGTPLPTKQEASAVVDQMTCSLHYFDFNAGGLAATESLTATRNTTQEITVYMNTSRDLQAGEWVEFNWGGSETGTLVNKPCPSGTSTRSFCASHTYKTGGTYTITARSFLQTDGKREYACTQSGSVEVRVTAPPSAKQVNADICPGWCGYDGADSTPRWNNKGKEEYLPSSTGQQWAYGGNSKWDDSCVKNPTNNTFRTNPNNAYCYIVQ